MKLIQIELDGRNVTIVCDSRDTRSGFAHDATLFVNGCHWNKASCYYLNRTWESWNYQSACIAAVQNALDYNIKWATNCFKDKNNVKRITAKRRPELDAYINEDADIVFLRKLKQHLRDNRY